MDMNQLIVLGLQVSIVCTVFGYGLKTTTSELLYVVRRPALLARSLISVFVVMPVVAFAVARFFSVREVVEVSLVALAISPVPPLLPMKEMKAGGRTSYSLGLLALLALLSIVTIPLAIEVLERLSGRTLEVGTTGIARLALMTVVVPLFGGMLVRARASAIAERIASVLNRGAKLVLLLAAAVLLAGSWRSVWAATGQDAIVAIVVFVFVGFAVGHLLGGPERETSVVLGLSSACRHPAIAFSIASANYPDQRLGGVILLYLLVSLLLGIPYVRWNRARAAR